MIKTQLCEECEHFSWIENGGKCALGHKLRFFNPRLSAYTWQDKPYGYKKKCLDFVQEQNPARTTRTETSEKRI